MSFTREPEGRIAIFGFFTAFVWEMWQMPFYETHGMAYIEMVRGCTFASFGDAGIMVFAYFFAGKISGNRRWLVSPNTKQLYAYILIGQIITIVIEHLALNVPFGWRYADKMPIVPVLGTGMVPILMWVIVPLLVIALARTQIDKE